METYKDLKDRCYNIKDKFLSSVFAKFGMNDLHKIIFFIIHKQEIYYFGIRIDENWFNQLFADDQILMLDIYKFYENKNA